MIRATLLAASAVALSLSATAVSANTFAAGEVAIEETASYEFSIDGKYIEGVYIAEAVVGSSANTDTVVRERFIEPPASQASPVRLVEWSGDFELMKTSQRLRIWRSHVAYKLTVGTDGTVTNCELVETFRRRHVTESLCDILSEHHQFEPALDDSGSAVESSYTDRISYAELRARL